MEKNVSEFKPVFCPVLNEDVDPRLCYETRFGIINILGAAGVSEDDSMKVCRSNCNKIRGFVENDILEDSSAVAEKNMHYQ